MATSCELGGIDLLAILQVGGSLCPRGSRCLESQGLSPNAQYVRTSSFIAVPGSVFREKRDWKSLWHSWRLILSWHESLRAGDGRIDLMSKTFQSKPCIKCGSIEERNKRGACRACAKAYREAHREEKAARRKAYHETHPEKQKVCTKAYRETHQEEIAAYRKAYRKARKASDPCIG